MGEVNRNTEHEERETQEFMRRSSIAFLECAIAMMSLHMSVEEIGEILEGEIDILYGYE